MRTLSIHLPESLRPAAAILAREGQGSRDQLTATALAEKIAALETTNSI